MTEQDNLPKQANPPGDAAPRKRFRFSLGSIFGFTLSIALVLAWFTQVMLPQDKLREEAIGVMMTYGGMGYSHSWSPLGISVTLDLRYSAIPPAAVEKLAANPVVVSLDLSHTRTDDDDLVILEEAKNLRSLRLVDTQVTEEGIANLRAARGDLEVILE